MSTRKEDESFKLLAAYEIEKLLDIENILGLKNTLMLDYRKALVCGENNAKTQAHRLRKELIVGNGPIGSAIELIDDIGIKTVEVDTCKDFLSARSLVGQIPFIVLNKNLTPERKRLHMFYQMGLLLLNFTIENDKDGLRSIFAMEVLMPDKKLAVLLGPSQREIPLEEFQSRQRQYGVEVELLMRNALWLGIITPKRYSDFCKRKSPDFVTFGCLFL